MRTLRMTRIRREMAKGRKGLTGWGRLWIGAALFAVAASACGNGTIIRINMDETEAQIEELRDPVGFERTGVELVDEETGILLHQGGFVVSWAASGESPELVLESFLPVLGQVGFVPENDPGQLCNARSLRLFMVDTNDSRGSMRLFYDVDEGVVRLLAGWDSRPPELVDRIEEGPTCADLG